MSLPDKSFRLLLVGIGPRLGIAAAIAALLWLGFVWAIATPGAS